MSAAAGWYPDPGGGPGLYRFWDGRAWSAAVSPTPTAPPPPPVGAGATRSTTPPGRPAVGAPHASGRGRALGWLLALAAVVVVLAVVAVLAVQRAVDSGGGTGVGGQPSTPVCPAEDLASPEPQPADGRVHAGKLSYERLGDPWSAPEPESQVAFGKGVLLQSVVTENSGNRPWLAAVLLGELVAGDGFFSPRDGAAVVVRCVSGTFYGGAAVTRDDVRDEALTVDGHDAWVVESQLGFHVPGVRATSERLIVVVVDTGTGTSGLFYASIPENAPQLLQPARDALASVTVDG